MGTLVKKVNKRKENKVDINEARDLKDKLERDIIKLLRKFESETELFISDIDYSRSITAVVAGEPTTQLDFKVFVELQKPQYWQ